MASSTTQSTPSVSNSDNFHSVTPNQGAGTSNAVPEVFEKKPEIVDLFADMDSMEYIDKFKKYEDDYTRRLKGKYFSDKNIFGGNVFDVKLTIDGETIKASRWPGYKSYADPMNFDDLSSSESMSGTEIQSNSSTGKHPMRGT